MLQMKNLMHKTLITIAGCALMAISTFAVAGDKPSFAPRVPHPTNGTTECVQPEDEMKKNHMKYILHQRDETMRKGIRTETYSLKECINCHIPENSEVRFGDSKHFCSSCHNYAGVSIDCFQCHMDRPMKNNPKNAQLTPSINTAETPATQTEIADTSVPISSSVQGASNE